MFGLDLTGNFYRTFSKMKELDGVESDGTEPPDHVRLKILLAPMITLFYDLVLLFLATCSKYGVTTG